MSKTPLLLYRIPVIETAKTRDCMGMHRGWRGGDDWVVVEVETKLHLIPHDARPGLLNSVAGIIATVTNAYETQGNLSSSNVRATIIVTGTVAVICGVLVMIYQCVFIRRLRKDHERIERERNASLCRYPSYSFILSSHHVHQCSPILLISTCFQTCNAVVVNSRWLHCG